MINANLYIQLLEELDKNGINKTYDVSPFMSKNFPKPDFSTGLEIGWNSDKEGEAKGFLHEMKLRKYIEFDQDHLSKIAHYQRIDPVSADISTDKWFDSTFKITLTLSGLDYLNQYRLIQSNLDVNRASKRSFWSVLFLGILTLVSSGISTCNGCRQHESAIKKNNQPSDTKSQHKKSG